jgi:hypothetical protein
LWNGRNQTVRKSTRRKTIMKNFCLNTTLALVCLLVACAAPSWAESGRIDFTAPFPFTVGGVELPAGAYQITSYAEGGAIFVTGTGTPNAATAIMYPLHSDNPADKASVRFVRRGEKYILRSVGMETGQVFELASQR